MCVCVCALAALEVFAVGVFVSVECRVFVGRRSEWRPELEQPALGFVSQTRDDRVYVCVCLDINRSGLDGSIQSILYACVCVRVQ